MGRTLLRVKAGDRFAGLSGSQPEGGPLVLSAYLATAGAASTRWRRSLPPGAAGYPALTPRLGAAFWYERVIHDRFGVVPDGHPRLAPLIRPGPPEDYALPRHVAGYGVFTIPHGPVRSGVMESIEYLVETPGEAIPHLNMRVFYKHRGIADRFAGTTPADGVLLAERAEGIASVAHALAFCHAVETDRGLSSRRRPRPWSGCCTPSSSGSPTTSTSPSGWPTRPGSRWPPPGSRCTRSGCSGWSARCAAAGSAAAWWCPAGLARCRCCRPRRYSPRPGKLRKAITADADALMGTSSFLDRLRGTGPLTPARARQHGALGPIGKASGYADDARLARPYDGYPSLTLPSAPAHAAGDALARLRVRWEEVDQAFGLIRRAAEDLAERTGDPARLPLRARPGPGGRLGRSPAGRGPLRRGAGRTAGSPAASPGRRRSTTWC